MVSFLKNQNTYNGEIDEYVSSRYRVIARLSKGGTSEIYKAIDLFNKSKVAIKIFPSGATYNHKDGKEQSIEIEKAHEIIIQEARFLETCQHPNIIHLLDYNLDGQLPYIVLDFLENITLEKEILYKGRTFSIKETLGILEQICGALGYVHNKGYVYCDLKPNNIISIHQNLTLIDFGLVRRINQPIIGGTIGYMAPEALQSYKNPVLATPALDIYSLGVLLYALLTEYQPMTHQKNNSEPPNANTAPKLASELNPYLPKVFDSILLRCIEKNPENRYQSMEQLIQDFTRAARSFI